MHHLTRTNTRPGFFKKAATAAAGLLASGIAAAQGLAAAVTSEVDTAELIAIGVIVLGVAGVILMIRSGRRAAS